jgi:hypothetical protein
MASLENLFIVGGGFITGTLCIPCFFVLAENVLQSIINKARILGLLRLPLTDRYGEDFPIVQYVDDSVVHEGLSYPIVHPKGSPQLFRKMLQYHGQL